MKVKQPKGKFTVSFNTSVGEYAVGDEDMNTVDFVGNDITKLANEVIADSNENDFPMVFVAVEGEEDGIIVGMFYEEDDQDREYPVALMLSKMPVDI